MFAMKIKTKQINKMKENVVFLEVYYYFSSFVNKSINYTSIHFFNKFNLY